MVSTASRRQRCRWRLSASSAAEVRPQDAAVSARRRRLRRRGWTPQQRRPGTRTRTFQAVRLRRRKPSWYHRLTSLGGGDGGGGATDGETGGDGGSGPSTAASRAAKLAVREFPSTNSSLRNPPSRRRLQLASLGGDGGGGDLT